jgi:prepilin signal peptidase PulO-like enzyme (type II secretory pathway)
MNRLFAFYEAAGLQFIHATFYSSSIRGLSWACGHEVKALELCLMKSRYAVPQHFFLCRASLNVRFTSLQTRSYTSPEA